MQHAQDIKFAYLFSYGCKRNEHGRRGYYRKVRELQNVTALRVG